MKRIPWRILRDGNLDYYVQWRVLCFWRYAKDWLWMEWCGRRTFKSEDDALAYVEEEMHSRLKNKLSYKREVIQ